MPRDPITADLVQRILPGVGGEWTVSSNGHLVGGGRVLAVIKDDEARDLLARAADIADWALHEHERARRAEVEVARLQAGIRRAISNTCACGQPLPLPSPWCSIACMDKALNADREGSE